jgi:hypothetical protein
MPHSTLAYFEAYVADCRSPMIYSYFHPNTNPGMGFAALSRVVGSTNAQRIPMRLSPGLVGPTRTQIQVWDL